MQQPLTATLGRWAWIGLFSVAAVVSVTNTVRYLPPSGDRFVDTMSPGSTDLIPSFNAAAALLRGRNPYRSLDVQAYQDPYANTRGEQEGISYLYPPTHALIYVPVVWLAHNDFKVAARLHLVITLGCLALLAWVVLDLLGALVELDANAKLALLPLLALVMALNPGSMLGFERGQSDVITATLCWCSIAAWRRGWLIGAAFLAAAGTLLKGYGLVLALGVVAIGWRRDNRTATLLGASAAASLLLLPVLRYLPDALFAYRIRASMFWPFWYNQGFANLLEIIGLPHEGLGRVALVAGALLTTFLAWLQLRRVDSADNDPRERALWATAFGMSAIIAVLGYSLNSLVYNCVLVMPGALVLVLGQAYFVQRLPARVRTFAGPLLAATLLGLFAFDFGRLVGFHAVGTRTPAAGLAELVLVILVAVAATRELAGAGTLARFGLASAWSCVGVLLLLFFIQLGVERAMLRADLTRDKTWTASSNSLDCFPERRNCGGGRLGVFVHTTDERNPWVMYDLGMSQTIAAIEVVNREDCCKENTIPLVLEVSSDRVHWQLVATRVQVFDTWRARFKPVKARYVRARVPRKTILHIERLSIWPS